MKKLLSVALVLVMIAGTAVVWAGGAKEQGKGEIGLVIWNKNNPVVQIMEAGFLEKGKELGYSAVLYAAGPPDLALAISLGEQAIAKKVKGLVIYLLDPGIYPLIKKAADAGIPVVTAHTEVTNGDQIPGLLAWCAADPKLIGKEAAKAIGDKVGGKGTVAITQGSFNQVENDQAAAFTDYIHANYPDMKVLPAIEEGFDVAMAESRIVALLEANPDIVAGFGTTGGSPVTWAAAKRTAGQKDIVAIGMDYSEQNLDLVKSGEIFAVIAQPLFEEHALAAELLDKLIRGEKVPFDNLMEAPLVTKDNVQKYYDQLATVKKAFENM